MLGQELQAVVGLAHTGFDAADEENCVVVESALDPLLVGGDVPASALLAENSS
ncbi:hypothetical protein [Nocardia sp. NPDC127526]|uniref:hypothetical protein n=1 Tax=Nocardia sp. NPDC127526 TaxID=3345393 RepID=UPI0036294383